MKNHCESIDYKFEFSQKPQRVISLVSAATETLFAMGCGNRPDLFLLFSESEYPVVSEELLSERGWDRSLKPNIVASTVTRGQNLIQERPSFLETATWLQNQFFALIGR